jgi:hypothetical protein
MKTAKAKSGNARLRLIVLDPMALVPLILDCEHLWHEIGKAASIDSRLDYFREKKQRAY